MARSKSSPNEQAASETLIPAAQFKARCLAILDQVAITGESVTVTKRGKPVARVIPIPEEPSRSMFGSVTFLSSNPEDYYSTGEIWNAEQGEL